MKPCAIDLKVLLAFVFMILFFSCKKEGKPCISCTAVCSGVSSGSMNYCGDDLDAQEAGFRAAHEGCEVACSR